MVESSISRDEAGGRHDGGRSLSEVAARRQGGFLQHGSLSGVCRADRDYLATLGPKYPKTLEQMIARAKQINALRDDGGGPNPARWTLFTREAASGTVNDYNYKAVHDYGMPMVAHHRRRHHRGRETRRHRLPDIVAPPGAHRSAAGHAGRGARKRQQPREPDRISGSDRAGRIHRRSIARRVVVLRAGVQRAKASSRSATPSSRPRTRDDDPSRRRHCRGRR